MEFNSTVRSSQYKHSKYSSTFTRRRKNNNQIIIIIIIITRVRRRKKCDEGNSERKQTLVDYLEDNVMF